MRRAAASTPRHVYRFVTLAIDRRDGRIVWERVATEERPHESTHPINGTWASSSAVTDGEFIIAFFESRGMYAYDMNGKLLWQKRFGEKTILSETGEGTTPALYGNYVVLVWDHQGESFIVALDKHTGKELWRVPRAEADTWSTPLIVEHDGRAQVVTTGWGSVQSYDLETGKVVWHTSGLTPLTIPSPVADEGMVIATSGFNGSSLKAIRLAEAKGDITGTSAIAWTLDRDTPYSPSPLLYGGLLYLLKSNNGLLSVFDAKTGTPHYRVQRLADRPERLLVAGRGRRARLHRRRRRRGAGDSARAEVRGACHQRDGRRLHGVAGARGERDLSARQQVSVLHCRKVGRVLLDLGRPGPSGPG